MNASISPESKAPAQTIAMKIFRNQNLTSNAFNDRSELEDLVDMQLGSYTAKHLTWVVEQHAGLQYYPDGSDDDFREKIRGMMVQIVVHEMKQIVRAEPRYPQTFPSPWIFLGGDIRDPRVGLTYSVHMIPPDEVHVEYWGRLDYCQVAVVYGPRPYHLEYVHMDELEAEAEPLTEEAFRRLKYVWEAVVSASY